jgi:hypothetical protein
VVCHTYINKKSDRQSPTVVPLKKHYVLHVHINKIKMVWPLVGAEIDSSTNDEVSDLVTGGATLIRSRQNHRGLKCGEDSILGATFLFCFLSIKRQ